MPFIECGICTIEYQEPSNLMLTHLIEQFKDMVEIHNPDVVLEHLDNLKTKAEDGTDDEYDTVKEMEELIDVLKDEVHELELELEGQKEVDCGIGNIKYTADNLLLEQLMEELTDAIQSSTPLEVLRMLEQFTKQKIAA